MHTWKNWALALVLSVGAGFPGRAQSANNDGFQRRHGPMQVVRNGQARPMTRDAHLPPGATITKDGFVVSTDGRRTELREGQGCDLRGRPVTVVAGPTGALALAPVVVARPAAAVNVSRNPSSRSLLEEIFGGREDDRRYYKQKKYKKHGKGRGRWKDDYDD